MNYEHLLTRSTCYHNQTVLDELDYIRRKRLTDTMSQNKLLSCNNSNSTQLETTITTTKTVDEQHNIQLECRINQQQQQKPNKSKHQQQTKMMSPIKTLTSFNRRSFVLFGAYTILAIILIELVLISPNVRPVEAGKKKKILKKIKEVLPLLALLKRKKIVLLPIPM